MSEQVTIPEQTEVISFDLWLTLIKSDGRTFKTERNAMLGRLLAPQMEAAVFDETVRGIDKASDRLAEARGADVMFDERVAMVAEAVGAETPSSKRLERLYADQAELLLQHPPVLLEEDAPEHLSRLADRFDLGLISNTGFIHGAEMRGILADLGIADKFSHLIFSNEIGYAKPDRRIYGALTTAAAVTPPQVTHVGDNYEADVKGAERLGMHAIHFADGVTLESIAASVGGARHA